MQNMWKGTFCKLGHIYSINTVMVVYQHACLQRRVSYYMFFVTKHRQWSSPVSEGAKMWVVEVSTTDMHEALGIVLGCVITGKHS